MENNDNFLLQGYRALDLTDEKGFLCAKILADLGVDVIKIEQPGGDQCRRYGPFFHLDTHPEKSLLWAAYNTNKRGITLDITTRDGQTLFKRLAENADFIIESFPTGYMSDLGLGYETLKTVNPLIIMTSITPFGQEGPCKDWKGSDIVSMATGGFMALVGDGDRPPVRVSLDQACLHACSEGAIGLLIALYDRHNSGQGQHIDVSIQASVVTTSISAIPYWDMGQIILRRSGSYRVGQREGGKKIPQQWACNNGFVSYAIWGGQAGIKTNQALVDWMKSDGMATETLLTMDWASFDIKTADDTLMNNIEDGIASFFLAHTKEELYQGALERRIQLFPINNIKDIVHDPQLKARGFWEKVEYGESGTEIIYPGAFAKSSEAGIRIYRPAPKIGEHNKEIYQGELCLSDQEMNILRQSGVI
ncbi:MAG: CoA transferase [Deltaproteobacteria bacterium]|nr:CoA transferase [Deltaproteobacteria bacterium]